MAIGDRVKEAIDKLNQGDPVNALIQVCIAIDSTSKKEFHGKIKRRPSLRYKAFIKKHQAFITKVAMGKLEIAGPIRFQMSESDVADYKTMEDILYKIVRCSLLHEGELPKQVEITNKNVLGITSEGKFLFSLNLIMALIMAVVGSEVNANQRIPDGYSVGIGNTSIDFNDLWGKRDEIHHIVWEHNKP